MYDFILEDGIDLLALLLQRSLRKSLDFIFICF